MGDSANHRELEDVVNELDALEKDKDDDEFRGFISERIVDNKHASFRSQPVDEITVSRGMCCFGMTLCAVLMVVIFAVINVHYEKEDDSSSITTSLGPGKLTDDAGGGDSVVGNVHNIWTTALQKPRVGENLEFFGPFTFSEPGVITSFLPLANMSFVHHLLIYKHNKNTNGMLGYKRWDELPDSLYNADRIVYAWARTGQDRPLPFEVPEGSGFWVGPGSDAVELYINVHYEVPKEVVTQKDPVKVGVALTIDPKTPEKVSKWMNCADKECREDSDLVKGLAIQILEEHRFKLPAKLQDYAVRHLCKVSRDVYLYAYRNHGHLAARMYTTSWYRDGVSIGPLVNRSAQDSQILYTFPESSGKLLKKNDILVLDCHYNTLNRNYVTEVGADLSKGEEMCNQYLMYYPHFPLAKGLMCQRLVSSAHYARSYGQFSFPPPVKTGMPPAESLGQVAGVGVSFDGTLLYVFARRENQYFSTEKIKSEAIIAYNTAQDRVIGKFGNDLFVTPHGLHCDEEGNIWVTDTTLHQVFKLNPWNGQVLLTLGQERIPGNLPNQFNSPTDVAVDTKRKEVYISDGYGNNRVVVFSTDGKYLREWRGDFDIVHNVAFDSARDRVYVADRENGRIQIFDRFGKLLMMWKSEYCDRKYLSSRTEPYRGHLSSVSYSAHLDMLFSVEGVHLVLRHPESGQVRQAWEAEFGFKWPHDVDVGLHAVEPVVYTAELDSNRTQRFMLTRAQ